MKIIFLKDVAGGGKKRGIAGVNEGGGEKFFLAQRFAQIASPQIQAKVAKEQKEAEAKKHKELEKFKNLKADIEKRVFTVKIKVGDKGQIFSGVHEKDIVAAINKKHNLALDKKQVEAAGVIKTLGLHTVKVRLFPGLFAEAKINVEPE